MIAAWDALKWSGRAFAITSGTSVYAPKALLAAVRTIHGILSSISRTPVTGPKSRPNKAFESSRTKTHGAERLHPSGIRLRTPSVSTKADNALGRDRDRLMAAAQAGDVNAYRTLLSELAVWLRRYYARRLPPVMIEDAVQDVLLAIHEKRHTYDPKRSLAPWLAAIARYKWIDRLRSLRSEAAEPLGENLGIPDHGDSVIAGTTCQQLAELQPPQAEVVRPVKLETYSVEEAFRATGRLSAPIKVNFHRGIRRLADIIKATGDAF